MRFSEYRKLRGLRLADVGEALGGLSVPHMSQLENGVVPFTLKLALLIEDWSDGAVRAVDLLREDDATLLGAAIARGVPQPAEG